MSVVYFIQCGEDGPIKIGFTDGDVERRRCNLQMGCPYPLTLIAAMPGGAKEEAELHARFASIRCRGEWFWPAGELTRFIEGIGKPEPRPSLVPIFSDTNPARKLRKAMRLTQAELGKHLSMSQPHVARMELAPRLNPRTHLALLALHEHLSPLPPSAKAEVWG